MRTLWHLLTAAALVLSVAQHAWAEATNAEAADRPATNKHSASITLKLGGDKEINITPPEDSEGLVLGLSPEILAKLPPEEISRLVLEREKLRHAHNSEDIIVPIAFFACPVFIVATVLFFRFRRNRLLHDTLRAMIDKGVPIPPELLQTRNPVRLPRSDFRRGLVWSAIGLGMVVYLVVDGSTAWALGLIPLLIGAAFLVTWKVEQGSPRARL